MSAAEANLSVADMPSQSDDDLEELNSNCHVKDSSNDEEIFRDSSNDEGYPYATGSNSEPHTSKGKRQGKSEASTSQSSSDSSSPADEVAMMLVSEKEQDYYDGFLHDNQDQISSLKCTTCSCQLFVATPEHLRIHPALGVLICKNCREFYSNGPFTKDETGHDEYCRWCAEGGVLICCDTCSNVFCKACLRRCIGRAALLEISNSGCSWSCLLCDNSPIWEQRALCRLAFGTIQKQSRHRSSISRKDIDLLRGGMNDDPAVWVPAMLNQAEKLAVHFKSLVAKIGNTWIKQDLRSATDNKNSAHQNFSEEEKLKVASSCRKLRKAIVNSRFKMKLLEKNLITTYTAKFKNAADIEIDAHSASEERSACSPTHEKRLVVKIKNFREGKHRNSYYAEIDDAAKSSDERPPRKSHDSTSVSTVPISPSNSKQEQHHASHVEKSSTPSKDEKETRDGILNLPLDGKEIQEKTLATAGQGNESASACSQNLGENAAMPKIKEEPSSPERGSENLETGILGAGKTSTPTNRPSSLNKSESPEQASPDRRHGSAVSKLKFHSSPNLEHLNDKIRRDLLKDTDEESDDSLAELTLSPRVKRTRMRNASVPSGLNDPKLKAECAVVLNRLPSEGQEALLQSEDSAIDKKIKQLLKPVSLSARKEDSSSEGSDSEDSESDMSATNKKRNGTGNSKEPVKRTAFRLSDLGSPSSESSDIEDQNARTDNSPGLETAYQSIDANEVLRQALLQSSSSDTEHLSEKEDQIDDTQLKTELPFENESSKGSAESNASAAVKMEVDEESSEETSDQKSKERERSLSPETAKLLRDPISAGGKKSNESDAKEAEGKRKSRDKRKRRVFDSDSDFQSSGSGKEEKQKSSKKKKVQSSDDDFEDEDSKPKRRRRIKKMVSSDSEASDDSDIEILNETQRSDGGAGSKGRKNIKKIMKDTSLKDETKKAAKEEEERKRRIAERQKLYNENFVGDKALENARVEKLVLDFDPNTKQELVTVDKRLVTKLKPHQVKGVKFMFDACFESIERIKEHPGSGCILAHCMGLGKSLQVVTLSHTVLTHTDCQVERVLVVCPLSTVLNWLNEFKIWLPDSSVSVYELASAKTNDSRVSCLRKWMETGGVLIIGYDMYRNLSNEQNKRIKGHARMRETFQRSLVDPGPQLVVCDEGHLLKNEATALSKAMNRIATRRRIVLTGTPLQNSLLEYHCMIQFVKPNLLGTKKEFTNRFANPIKNGQAADSTDSDVRVMKRRAHVLHKMLEDSVQRFDYSVLTPFLPPKHEYVISVKMSEMQIKMYQYYLEKHAKGVPGYVAKGKGAGLFADFQELGRVWTHPRALMLSQLRRELRASGQSDSEGSIADFIDDRETPTTEEDVTVVNLDDSGDEAPAVEIVRKPRTRASRGEEPPPEDELGVTVPMGGSWWSQFVTEEDMTRMEHSGKLVLLMDILRQCELIGDKVLVFSQSLVSLDLIEEFLQIEDKRNEENRANLGCESSSEKVDHIGSWQLNGDYFRLDGQTSPELRKNWCNTFNSPSNHRARLFLISTKAGGLGINLVAANRVIIFDASWNPSHDVQSIFRVYRFGQKKPCYIYRFLAQGTMEEKIYDRQVTKLSLSCRVVDEQQIERHFNSADLNELYVFEPDSHLRRPTPLLPKDRLLAELTIQRKEWIVTYHEHDSLLENKAEEELSEAERKAAWDDFENEKRGHPQIGLTASDPMATGHFGIPGMTEIFASLAGRAVAGIPLSNIAAMIYNSNPGISQDEFLGRLRLTVDQLQNFSVQQASASVAAAPPSAPVQQPGDAQRLIMQRQVAQDQLKRQFGNSAQSAAVAGPSGMSASNPLLPPRSRGRPTIGPHQRTDLYGLAPVIAASTQQGNLGLPPSGPNVPPKT